MINIFNKSKYNDFKNKIESSNIDTYTELIGEIRNSNLSWQNQDSLEEILILHIFRTTDTESLVKPSKFTYENFWKVEPIIRFMYENKLYKALSDEDKIKYSRTKELIDFKYASDDRFNTYGIGGAIKSSHKINIDTTFYDDLDYEKYKSLVVENELSIQLRILNRQLNDLMKYLKEK